MQSYRWVRPLSMARGRATVAVTAACILGVMAVPLAETAIQSSASLGALLFLPVLVAAWALPRAPFLLVSGLAVAARVIGMRLASVDVASVVAEAVVVVALAFAARAVAAGILEWRSAEADVEEQQRRIGLLLDRDRIAATVNDAVVRQLFATTLQLEAIVTRLDDAAQQEALRTAIRELDDLTTRLRTLVFAELPDRPGLKPGKETPRG